jgi:hypothetical protein
LRYFPKKSIFAVRNCRKRTSNCSNFHILLPAFLAEEIDCFASNERGGKGFVAFQAFSLFVGFFWFLWFDF